jgi:hypothetical protein
VREQFATGGVETDTGQICHRQAGTPTAQETVARYYSAWQTKQGDFGEVPLADDFQFSGPVASFDTAEGYRAMAR